MVELGEWLRPSAVTALFAASANICCRLSDRSGTNARRGSIPCSWHTSSVSRLLYWLAAFNTFDRYLLSLAPLMAVVAAHDCNPSARISSTGWGIGTRAANCIRRWACRDAHGGGECQ
jgi:hypothetical protein